MPKSLSVIATTLACAVALAACGSSSGSTNSSAATSGGGATGTASLSQSGTSTGTSSAAQPTATTGAATTKAQIGFEGVPLEQGPQLAPASTTGTGKVDGISCAPQEQLVYHIHAHLAVFDKGTAYVLPAGVGIPGSQPINQGQGPIAAGGRCIYWLHTHTTDGIIHIESPTKRIYTLGDFFDEWQQPLSPTQVGTLKGKITAFVNGKPWTKNPRLIPLLSHEDIQLEIGEPVPPLVKVNWAATQL